jgi:hypothetical protein
MKSEDPISKCRLRKPAPVFVGSQLAMVTICRYFVCKLCHLVLVCIFFKLVLSINLGCRVGAKCEGLKFIM